MALVVAIAVGALTYGMIAFHGNPQVDRALKYYARVVKGVGAKRNEPSLIALLRGVLLTDGWSVLGLPDT